MWKYNKSNAPISSSWCSLMPQRAQLNCWDPPGLMGVDRDAAQKSDITRHQRAGHHREGHAMWTYHKSNAFHSKGPFAHWAKGDHCRMCICSYSHAQ
jgi:hypothetical protein